MVRFETRQADCEELPSSMDPFATVIDLPVSPTRIGAYRILHPIASGAMGQVHCAVNEGTNEKVALKLIGRKDGRPTGERDRTFFLREMSNLSRLNHPRIIRICDFGSADGRLFLAMEYIKTIDLSAELKTVPASQQERLVSGIGCYILSGLAHAHEQNIVHRDIKPENLLVSRNDQNKIGVKVADFGMSKDFRNAGLSGMTGVGELRGTPAFMAPEQLCNSRDAGPECDLYATAAVLYFFLTGKVPHEFGDDEAAGQLCRIVREKPTPIRVHRSDLSPGLCDVIDRGLLPAHAGRYASAVEFNQALLPFTRKK